MYLVNDKANYDIHCGFELNEQKLMKSLHRINNLLEEIPSKIYVRLDSTTISGIISSHVVLGIEENTDSKGNPHSHGRPDLLPSSLHISKSGIYTTGLEIKCTPGAVDAKKYFLEKCTPRIKFIDDIKWTSHHNFVRSALYTLWDYNTNGIPFITACMLTKLNQDCFSTFKRSSNACRILPPALKMIASNWVVLYDNPLYINTYSRLLGKNLLSHTTVHFDRDDVEVPRNNLSEFFN
jgi:hypothetical protein